MLCPVVTAASECCCSAGSATPTPEARSLPTMRIDTHCDWNAGKGRPTPKALEMSIDLKIMDRFKAAELVAPIQLPPQATVDVDACMKQASSSGMRTVKFHIDLSAILEPLGPHKVMRYNPDTKCVEVVSLLTKDDAFPEPAAFSRSSAVIVWRQQGGGPVEVVLVKERNANRVSFVAGGQKPHESSLAGAIREVQEEVGLKLDLATLK
jgi:hypothetical protein